MIRLLRSPCAALLVMLAAGALGGCASHDLQWEIRVDPPSLSAAAARIDARILRGACPGTDVVWNETVYPTDVTNDAPPDLDQGTYCFEAFVGSAGCEWIAHGTATVELPRDELLVVTATSQAPVSNCATTCESGLCAGGGGGGTCPLGGCTFRCDEDCSASCTGGGCTMQCVGTATCDFACPGGGCHVLCADTSDCTASCAAGMCDMACTDVGGCDFSCAAGMCDFTCMTTDVCATSCPLGNCTGD